MPPEHCLSDSVARNRTKLFGCAKRSSRCDMHTLLHRRVQPAVAKGGRGTFPHALIEKAGAVFRGAPLSRIVTFRSLVLLLNTLNTSGNHFGVSVHKVQLLLVGRGCSLDGRQLKTKEVSRNFGSSGCRQVRRPTKTRRRNSNETLSRFLTRWQGLGYPCIDDENESQK